jgi:hypothetical protein
MTPTTEDRLTEEGLRVETLADLSRATPRPWRIEQTWRPPVGNYVPKLSETDGRGNVFWGYSIHGSDERGSPILPTLGAVHNFPDAILAKATEQGL